MIPAFQENFPKLKLHRVGFKPLSKTDKVKHLFYKQVRKFSGKDISYLLWKTPFTGGILINQPQWIEEVAAIASSKKYDLIQIEHIKNMGLISVLPESVKKIFVHHELLHPRVMQDMLANFYAVNFSQYIAGFMEAMEVHWLNKYDGIITFNQDDSKLLEEKGVTKKQLVSSPCVLQENALSNLYDPDAEQNLLFIGGEAHYPNKEGLLWLLNEIMPDVLKECPKVKLLITSEWTEGFTKKHTSDNIIYTGYVKDLKLVLPHSVMLVPIRIGSGIRVKAYTTFANGLPIVSTTLGVSGLPHLTSGENILIANDAPEFSKAIIALLKDATLRRKISEKAFATAREFFKPGEFVTARNNFYAEIIGQDSIASIV